MDIKPEDMAKFKAEQQQELMESIRHFIKYQALSKISDDFSIPEIAFDVLESMTKLYELQYEMINPQSQEPKAVE